ncbi:MAG: AI-2E family transporter [Planctomycetes bacterium]|nr:AI-2E family transporter [Planctomycetota bacterium]
MPRVVSFIVLLAIVLLTGSMFFQVMVQFIVPLFLAAVLVVIFKPLHQWILERCGHRYRLSAALTTVSIVLIVLLPITGMIVQAVSEGLEIYRTFNGPAHHVAIQTSEKTVAPAAEPPIDVVTDADASDASGLEAESPLTTSPPDVDQDAAAVTAIYDAIERLVGASNQLLAKIGIPALDSENVHRNINEQIQAIATPLAVGSVRTVASTLFGLAIMILTMYYFFADGPNMVAGLMKLSPLDDTYEQELLDKFGDISRAVVVAVLLSAIVQGLLAGIGYYFAGVEHVFFLTAATAFLAMVPFVGAAAIWVPVCAVLYFYTAETTTSAIVLAIYCGTVVSMSDNLVKPYVLHGQSNLHPLLALLSVIGGIQALGPIGILVGPMLVAFLQTLLVMLNKELHLLGQETDEQGVPAVFATDPPSTQKPKPKRNKRKKK